ncbi:antibiotic biosynthesis monooxygenase [Vicingaceae bacterium]|nr:antibiotic biosynthesis monooxygenase [Vicingaceae bacterium]
MIRIVKMTFNPEKVNEFLANFEEVKHKIRAFDGVKHLELLNDKNKSNIYFTYSIWESEDHLNNYRNSDLFKSVWAVTKPMFIEKADAWSVDSLVKLP